MAWGGWAATLFGVKRLFFSLTILCTLGLQSATAAKPNILFIMVDDLGKDWISCYGADEMIVSVCATRSNTSSWSAIMKQIVGVPSSSSGGRGTTGSMS